ncbi:MAG: HAD-IIB family hydrolase [Phycisphaeraceae bacterium]
MQYRMIGIDLDGTLLDARGQISDANRAAIGAAIEAGAAVIPCTGRGWREAVTLLRPVEGLELGVFVTGASITQIASGRSVDLSVIEPHLAYDLVEHLRSGPEAVLVFREAELAGHDYLVTGEGTLNAQTEWWFQYTGATVHFQRDVTADDLHHTLRVGVVTDAVHMPVLQRELEARFGDRVLMHHFSTIVHPEQAVHVLEIFAAGVDKWRGLSWVAQQRHIEASEIATIGDEINDLPMLAAAGCGVAMGNAIEPAKARARRVTRANDEDGVAYAIEQMLGGAW